MEKTRLPDDIRALNARLLTEPELTENVGPVHVLTVIGRASGKRPAVSRPRARPRHLAYVQLRHPATARSAAATCRQHGRPLSPVANACDRGLQGARGATQACPRPARALAGQATPDGATPGRLDDPADGQAVIELALGTYRRIDVLCNIAATAYFNWLEDVTDEGVGSRSLGRGRRRLLLTRGA